MGDCRSFREDRLASPGFAVSKIGRTCRAVIINGSIAYNRYEINSGDRPAGERGEEVVFLVLDFRTARFYLSYWVGSGRQL